MTYDGELFLTSGAVLKVANGWLRAITGPKGLGERVVHVVLGVIIVPVSIIFLSFLVLCLSPGSLGSLAQSPFFGSPIFLRCVI